MRKRVIETKLMQGKSAVGREGFEILQNQACQRLGRQRPTLCALKERDWQAVCGAGVGYEEGKGEMRVFSGQQQVFLCPGLDRIVWGFLGRYICYSGRQEATGISDQLSLSYLDRCPGAVGCGFMACIKANRRFGRFPSVSQPPARWPTAGKEGRESCRAVPCSPLVRMTEVIGVSSVCCHQSFCILAVIPA